MKRAQLSQLRGREEEEAAHVGGCAHAREGEECVCVCGNASLVAVSSADYRAYGGNGREVPSHARPLYFSIPPLFIISQVFQSVSPGVNSRHTNRLSRLKQK